MAELESPSPWKDVDGRAVYLTRKLGRPKLFGRPVLCDFGQARYGNAKNDDLIQPQNYRAPEVMLEMTWSYSVDIWNVGVMVCREVPLLRTQYNSPYRLAVTNS